MAAPLYIWEYNSDLMGQNRVPVIATLEASAGLDVKEGTLVMNVGGQVDEAVASITDILGIVAETPEAALNAGDPIKVALLAPGMVIKGTADADATALAGFNGKLVDVNADGSLDVGDVANGCLSVHRVENGGLTVYCVATEFAMLA
jgi:hypothetical protein